MKRIGKLLLKPFVFIAAVAMIPAALIWLGMEVVGFLSKPNKEANSESPEATTPEEPHLTELEEGGATRTLFAGAAGVQDTGPSYATGDHNSADGPIPPAWVVFKSGPRAGQSIALTSGKTSIGRGADNELVVEDPTISRQHASISFHDGQYVMEDAGSNGGTLVEGSPSQRTELRSGVNIKMGETEMVFMQSVPTHPSAPSAPTSGPDRTANRAGETLIMEPPGVLAWLAVTEGPDKGKTYQLKSTDTRVGRDTGNEVVLADTAASRSHALIKHQGGKFMLIDLGSKSGTRINNRPVVGKTLPPGGVVALGQTQLVLIAVETPEEGRPSSPDGATMIGETAPCGNVLVVQSGPDAGKSFTMAEGDNTIGRDPDCQIALSDPAVSRQHALVRRQDDDVMVYDLGSRSGTRVGDETMAGIALSPGDVVSIGRTNLVLMLPEEPR